MHVGIDLASGPDRTVLTAANQPFKWKKVGDRVRVGGSPNSIRHHISKKVSANQAHDVPSPVEGHAKTHPPHEGGPLAKESP